MKRKVFLIISIIILFILFIFLIFNGYKQGVQRKEKREDEIREKRYDEIRESIKKAMDWHIDASFVIRDEYHCRGNQHSSFDSQFLINNGFLKQREMLDVDGKSYCKARINKYMGDNCTMKYDIFLSCKNYEDEGYIN